MNVTKRSVGQDGSATTACTHAHTHTLSESRQKGISYLTRRIRMKNDDQNHQQRINRMKTEQKGYEIKIASELHSEFTNQTRVRMA
jgi:hypothetical protein